MFQLHGGKEKNIYHGVYLRYLRVRQELHHTDRGGGTAIQPHTRCTLSLATTNFVVLRTATTREEKRRERSQIVVQNANTGVHAAT